MGKFHHITSDSLKSFVVEYQNLSNKTPFVEKLAHFLDALRLPLKDARATQLLPRIKPGEGLNLEQLRQFLDELSAPLIVARQAGFFCNPWEIASLRRDEVRNSKVLAWLLDCRGNHGFGNSILISVLDQLKKDSKPKLPFELINDYRVLVENCPNGEIGNRVDIEIDGNEFYLIIEVKIDAPPGPDQLNRYCRIAAEKAKRNKREWMVIYLTCTGKASGIELEQDFQSHVAYLSWKDVARAISHSLRNKKKVPTTSPVYDQKIPKFLVDTFSQYIRKF